MTRIAPFILVSTTVVLGLASGHALAAAKAPVAPRAKIAQIEVARSSYGVAMALELLIENGTRLETKPGEAMLKLSMAFDPPLHATKVVIESCENEFRDGVEFAVAPGMTRFYSESGVATAKANFVAGRETEIRSLAISFGHNEAVCLKSLRFYDARDAKIPIEVELGAKDAPKAALADSKAPSAQREKLRESFSKSIVPNVLDQELIARSEDDSWIFRFRGDGTYYVYGKSEDPKSPGHFVALGEFEVVETQANKIKLSLRGQRWKAAQPWDGWYCGSACGQRELASPSRVDESVVIEKLSGTSYMVRNRNNPGRRSLPFGDAPVRSSSLQD